MINYAEYYDDMLCPHCGADELATETFAGGQVVLGCGECGWEKQIAPPEEDVMDFLEAKEQGYI